MRSLLLFGLVIFGNACTQVKQESATAQPYFDLENYFELEAKRLTKLNPEIVKTVIVNDRTEQKTVKIEDWRQEFGSFTDANINKAAWKGLFEMQQDGNSDSYTTAVDKIPVKKVEIFYKQKNIVAVKIFVNNVNKLYTSTDSLIYYPDSIYQIKKIQQIKLFDQKRYQVIGKFK